MTENPEFRVKTPIEEDMEKAGLKSMAPIMEKLNKIITTMCECPKCNGIMQPVKYKCRECGHELPEEKNGKEGES